MKELGKVILLEETKKRMEEDIGFTLEQMDNMDLCDIEKHIHQQKGYVGGHVPWLYKRCRDVLANQGRFITVEQHERDVKELVRKYLPEQYESLYGKRPILEKIKDYFSNIKHNICHHSGVA